MDWKRCARPNVSKDVENGEVRTIQRSQLRFQLILAILVFLSPGMAAPTTFAQKPANEIGKKSTAKSTSARPVSNPTQNNRRPETAAKTSGPANSGAAPRGKQTANLFGRRVEWQTECGWLFSPERWNCLVLKKLKSNFGPLSIARFISMDFAWRWKKAWKSGTDRCFRSCQTRNQRLGHSSHQSIQRDAFSGGRFFL